MDHLSALREPFSACSHGLWLMLSIPATFLLWKRSPADRARRFSLVVFGLCLAACYFGSTLYHAVRVDGDELRLYARIDHVGIHLLIAGTYTPLAWNLLRGRWKWGTLATIWGVTLVAASLLAADIELPRPVTTAKYLLLGWGALLCYVELTRVLSPRELRPLVIGGVLYSVGAMINLLDWPVLWPGIVGAHDVFHLWVMAGSVAHYQFILSAVAPQPEGAPTAVPAWLRPFRRPVPEGVA